MATILFVPFTYVWVINDLNLMKGEQIKNLPLRVAEDAFARMPLDQRIDLLLRHYADQQKHVHVSEYEKGLLEHLFSAEYPTLTGSNNAEDGSLLEKTTDIMKHYNLVAWSAFDTTDFLTPYGHIVLGEGGWLAKVSKDARKETVENSIRYWTRTSLVVQITTAIMTLALLVFTAYTAWLQLELQKELNSNNSVEKQALEEMSKELQGLKEELKSVVSQADSGKTKLP